ncbi:hypothetical protein MW887_008070 [Aspergillus wentii]|nr:hypothetical protein MW887_008070 [Aspergillus wentii]
MAAVVEINDAVFCQTHLLEVCGDCDTDTREENDSFYGFDAVDRAAITTPHVSQKDGVYKCSKHAIAS